MRTSVRSRNRLLTLLLAFAVVFTGMGIGSGGVDKAVALTSQDVVFLSTAKADSPRYQIEAMKGQEDSYYVWIPDSAKKLAYLNFEHSQGASIPYNDGKDKTFTGKIANIMKPVGKTVTVELNGKKYKYYIKNSASLSGLTVDDKEIIPTYEWNKKDYTVAVSSKTERIQVNVKTKSTADTRKITVNNQKVALTKVNDSSSGNIEVDLSQLTWGEDNTATILVVVSDTALEKGSEYTLKVECNPSVKIDAQSDTADKTYYDNETNPAEMSVTASAPTEISYQWYVASEADLKDARPIDGAATEKYKPQIDRLGEVSSETNYYYCEAKNTVEETEYIAKSKPWKVTVNKGIYPVVELTQEDGTAILDEGYFIDASTTDNTPVIKANVELPDGYTADPSTITYKWCREEDQFGAELGNSQTFSQRTYEDAVSNYYCLVSFNYNGIKFTSRSRSVRIATFGFPKDYFKYEPNQYGYADRKTKVGKSTKIGINVSCSSNGQLYYQWFASKDGEKYTPINELEQSIHGHFLETNITLDTPTKREASVDYYYCKAIYQRESKAQPGKIIKTELTTTPVKVTTEGLETVSGFEGKGTQDNPYLIKNITDLQKLRKLVNEQDISCYERYFRFEKDIIIPKADWTPIGTKNNFFMGHIDGNHKTLTVEKDGKPLLGYVREASVSNLNLKGERIDGNGLVDNYVVDYATRETITITNVTIKNGTNIVKSGFIGGYASGQDNVYITRCKIEKGVVIGCDKNQSNIGGFAGEFNGTIINCVNDGEVYGINFVGGIIADKGQCMGDCKVLNCTFSGKLKATGDYVGGISGAGYGGTEFGVDSAPNTPCISIRNCISSGNIEGKNYVGGILGAEPGVLQCWSDAYITDNLFTGSISADAPNAYIGGIVGYLNAINKCNQISNNFFCTAEKSLKGIGYIHLIDTSAQDVKGADIIINTSAYSNMMELKKAMEAIKIKSISTQDLNRTDDPIDKDKDKLCKAVSAEELKEGEVTKLLNSSSTSLKNWVQGKNGPEFSATPVVYEIKLSGNYKTSYVTGEAFSKEGIVVTGMYSDGTSNPIPLSEVTFSGFDSSKRAVQTIIVTYGSIKTSYQVTVLYNPSQVKEVTVTFTLLGDVTHPNAEANEMGGPHTLSYNNLKPWISTKEVVIDNNTTVYDVIDRELTAAKISWKGSADNQYGTMYISAVQNPETDVFLAEYDNGPNSGWMYTLNGKHSSLGVAQQFLNNGDRIVFHYTDDWTKESDTQGWATEEDKPQNVTTSGAAGSATTTAPTEVKVSGTTATATVKAENQSEILKQAAEKKSAEIILEVSKADSKGADSVQLSLEVSFVKNISDKTDADLTVNTENGKVTLDQETIKTVLAEAKGATITLEVTKVAKPTEVQKKAAGANGHLLKLTIKSGDKVISDFNKGKVKVVAEIVSKLLDKKVAAIHIADDGKIEQLAGKGLTIGGKKYYEFTTPHFSTFALVDAEELGLEVAEEPTVDAKALTAKLTPIARSAKTAKKNVKVTVSLDKQDKAIIKELKDAGYTVKYRFYRSTKKAAGYKAAVTKKTSTYTNTGGKKGTKYYYKVQVRVYDADGKLAAKTALKQCKYASRAWSR